MQLRHSYERDGYVVPIEVMTPGRAAEYRALFESVEATYTHDAVASRIVRGFASVVLPFVDEIMRLPSVLEPVKTILGDDLLVMGANFFIKEPATPAFVSWHQDLTYWGYDDVSEVTAWVASDRGHTGQRLHAVHPGQSPASRSSAITTRSTSRTCCRGARRSRSR